MFSSPHDALLGVENSTHVLCTQLSFLDPNISAPAVPQGKEVITSC